MALNVRDDVRAFLEQPHYAILATIGSDGVPQQTVLWYLLRDDVIIVNTAAGRVKERNLRRDARASICVTADGQAVTFYGPLELVDDQEIALADIGAMAVRYNGAEIAEQQIREQFGKEHRVTIRMRITRAIPQGFD